VFDRTIFCSATGCRARSYPSREVYILYLNIYEIKKVKLIQFIFRFPKVHLHDKAWRFIYIIAVYISFIIEAMPYTRYNSSSYLSSIFTYLIITVTTIPWCGIKRKYDYIAREFLKYFAFLFPFSLFPSCLPYFFYLFFIT